MRAKQCKSLQGKTELLFSYFFLIYPVNKNKLLRITDFVTPSDLKGNKNDSFVQQGRIGEHLPCSYFVSNERVHLCNPHFTLSLLHSSWWRSHLPHANQRFARALHPLFCNFSYRSFTKLLTSTKQSFVIAMPHANQRLARAKSCKACKKQVRACAHDAHEICLGRWTSTRGANLDICTCNAVVPDVFWYFTFKTSYTIVRPLMNCLRGSVATACVLTSLPVYPDLSNLKMRYSRNRIRKQIIPAIKFFLNPKTERALFQFAEFCNTFIDHE